MITPTLVVAAVLVALWASATGRTRTLFAALTVACAAGSYGYATTTPEPWYVAVPVAGLGSLLCLIGVAALVVACNRGDAR